MPIQPCPKCQNPTPRLLEARGDVALVNYYRCSRCGHLWTIARDGSGAATHLTPLDTARAAEADAAAGDRRPVLIIEDDRDSREMLEMLLRLSGFETTTAANGQEGLQIASERPPAVIVLDLMMPIMDGAEFRRAQRRDAALADIPVILVSAVHDIESVARELGVFGYLRKPVAVSELLALVRPLLQGAPGH